MATQARGARKRALSSAPPATTDGCVVTYYFKNRAFQRLFVESDIEGMKDVARKKLGIDSDTEIRLAQRVDGKKIDLEDEADFSAFQFGTLIKPEMYVEVSVSTPPVAQLASPSISSPSINFEPPAAGLVASTSHQLGALLPAAPAKPKKAKRTPTAPADSIKPDVTADGPSRPTKQTEPAHKGAPALPEPPATPIDNASQPKPKKRGRKSKTDVEAAALAAATASNLADATGPDESADQLPPPKKRRKSKAEHAETYGPVAVTLPAPGPSRRKSMTAATIDKPAIVAPVSAGSNADIIQRWASGSGASTSKSAIPSAPIAPSVVAVDDNLEVKEKPKKKKKKAKEEPVQAPVDSAPPVVAPCLVCLSAHPGSDVPLNCSLLSRRDADVIGIVEGRVNELSASQGPKRIHQMLIARLRDWMKERKQEAEARNSFAPPIASTPAPKINTSKSKKGPPPPKVTGVEARPTAGPSRPVLPKRSKLSSVAVSRQSEGSSTDDEDIVKSVMRHVSESDAESVEEDDGQSGEEMANVTAEPKASILPIEPAHEAPTSKSVAPVAVLVPLPRSSPVVKQLIRSSQHLSQSNVLALLDDLEDEEAGNQAGSDEEEDDGGSELARSTPSDVVRRRHRKSVRIEANDSDPGSAGEEDVEEVKGAVDGDVEMGDVDDGLGMRDNSNEGEGEPLRLSQILNSSQPLGADLSQKSATQDKGKGKGKLDDDIEEYESDGGADENENEDAPRNNADSPIEPAFSPNDQQPNDADEAPEPQPSEPKHTRQSKKADVEDDADADETETSPPQPKRRGRPPLSQAVKDERAAQKARIQAEKAAAPPKKRGRPSLTKSLHEEVTSEKNRTPAKPRTSVSGADTTKTGDANGSTMSVELPAPKTRSRASSQAASSQNKANVSQDPDTSITSSAPKKRGRPPLSQAVVAEREAEKERVRAEKAILRLEKRTAKANVRRAKGGGDAGSASEEFGGGADTTVDTGISGGPVVPNTRARDEVEIEESHPSWEVLKVPPSSSSRASSPHLDQIEWTSAQKPRSSARSMLPAKATQEERDAEDEPATKSRSRPLFMPSSGLAKANATHSGLPPSSPLLASSRPALSQTTPSDSLSRRRSVAGSMLPRFSAIKKEQDLIRQQRRASHIQPLKFESSQSLKPSGGSQEVLVVEDSSSDENSSLDEATNKTVTPSQKKKRSVLSYFTQD